MILRKALHPGLDEERILEMATQKIDYRLRLQAVILWLKIIKNINYYLKFNKY